MLPVPKKAIWIKKKKKSAMRASARVRERHCPRPAVELRAAEAAAGREELGVGIAWWECRWILCSRRTHATRVRQNTT